MKQMESRVFEGTSRSAMGNNHPTTSSSSGPGAVASRGHVRAVCLPPVPRGVHHSPALVGILPQLSSHLQLDSTARRTSPPATNLSARLRIFCRAEREDLGGTLAEEPNRPEEEPRGAETCAVFCSQKEAVQRPRGGTPGRTAPRGGQRHPDAGPRAHT